MYKHLIECSSLELLQLFKCACNVVWRFAKSNKVLMTKPNIKFTIGDKKRVIGMIWECLCCWLMVVDETFISLNFCLAASYNNLQIIFANYILTSV